MFELYCLWHILIVLEIFQVFWVLYIGGYALLPRQFKQEKLERESGRGDYTNGKEMDTRNGTA